VTTPLRIAVIGAGLIGRQHIERVLKNRDCRLTAVVDPAPGAADVHLRLPYPPNSRRMSVQLQIPHAGH